MLIHIGAADSDHLVVSFFNGKTAKVPKQTAVWIPHSEYERHRIEIQMPLTARHYVVNDPGYERYVSGYTIPSMQRESATVVGLPVLQQQNCTYVPMVVSDTSAINRSIRQSAVRSEELHSLIPGTDMTRQDLNVKVMKQLMDNKMLSSGSILRETSKSDKDYTLQKSVSFQEGSTGLDSGISSIRTELDSEGEEFTEEEKLEKEVEEIKRKIADSKQEISSMIGMPKDFYYISFSKNSVKVFRLNTLARIH